MLSANEVERLLERHGLAARRSLGQNFVVDPLLIERIVDLAELGPDRQVVEVGPGLGSLTLALRQSGARVLAVEKDRGLVPVLSAVLADRGAESVEIVNADALEVDWSSLLQPAEPPWSLVANLPYNVAVPIIMRVLEAAPAVHELLVMVQREVADRLVAGPGGRTIGIPTIKVAWFAAAEIVLDVPPTSFRPQPKVDSAVVRITRRPPPATDVARSAVFNLAATAYGQRRKMLRSSLGRSVSAAQFAEAQIDPTTRPERLSLQDWCALARSGAGAPAEPSTSGEPM